MFSKIVELCLVQNITIAELERLSGFGNGTIYRWKTSKPGADKLKKVADCLGVSVDYLLSDNPIEPSPKAYLIAKQFDTLNDTQKLAVLQVLNSYLSEKQRK